MLQHGVPVTDALMQQDKQGYLGQVLQVVRQALVAQIPAVLARLQAAGAQAPDVADLLGDVTLVGPGAGKMETGYAVLGDLLEIAAGK